MDSNLIHIYLFLKWVSMTKAVMVCYAKYLIGHWTIELFYDIDISQKSARVYKLQKINIII